MASPDVLDFESLLAPIPGDKPTGEDIRSDWSPTSLYYAIKDARSTARGVERMLEKDPEQAARDYPGGANWTEVLRLGPQILAQTSKDLEVAAWLTEALVRKHGYAGLRDGLRLARELVERYWDGLYPLPDEEEGLRTRVAPFTGLNGDDAEGTLIAPIKNIPITEAGSYAAFSTWQYEQAGSLDAIDDPDRRAARIEQGAVTLQMFDRAVAETSPEFFRNLWEDIDAAELEFGKLSERFDELCGSSISPPSSNIRNAIAAAGEVVRNITKSLFSTGDAGGEEVGAAEAMGDEAPGGNAANRKIMARDDAFRTLLQVADFFRRTEPHAPISYLLEQAVRWGKMPLPELLTELIPDESARDHLFRLVGIRPPENP
ncbi:MAG: type VI secretion system protein TssA [Pirellulales bacterium]|nr:type VI secretion system protein TssA [Pirellulales bacterium]